MWSNKSNIKRIYDLKGSMVGRKVKSTTKPTTTLKDINFLDNHDRKQEVNLRSKDALHLRRQLAADCEFLASLGIMDYSLLLGIEKGAMRGSD